MFPSNILGLLLLLFLGLFDDPSREERLRNKLE